MRSNKGGAQSAFGLPVRSGLPAYALILSGKVTAKRTYGPPCQVPANGPASLVRKSIWLSTFNPGSKEKAPAMSGGLKLIERMERFEYLCHALNSLPDAQGQRVFEHYLLGHSVKAIAAAEGVTERAVSAAIQRGLENMKKYLEKVL